jgi:MFS family permease
MAPPDETEFPPGTVRLSDSAESHIVLAPQPTSDPNDPLNWSTKRKTIQIALLSFYGIFVYALLTTSVVLWSAINEELGFSYDQLNNSYGVSAATLSIGCIMFVPFALRFGRRPIYLLTSLLMFATNIWAAKQKSLGDLYGTNVILGLAGSVNETLYQMTVGLPVFWSLNSGCSKL